MPKNFVTNQSTLVQEMASCRQAKAITWISADPNIYRLMTSPSNNELSKLPADDVAPGVGGHANCRYIIGLWSAFSQCDISNVGEMDLNGVEQ